MKWSLAHILEIHPGRDGIVQEVTLRGTSGTVRRALKNLYPLPVVLKKKCTI